MESIKGLKTFLLVLIDIIIIMLSYMVSIYIRLGWSFDEIYLDVFWKYIPVILLIYISMLILFKMYRSTWRIAGIDEVIYGAAACSIAAILNFIFMEIVPVRIPRVVTILSFIFITLMILGVRLSFRLIRRIMVYGNIMISNDRERVLIIGAGTCAHLLIDQIHKDKHFKYKAIGLIDDNPAKKGSYLNGVKVLGDRNKIPEICEKQNIHLILFAISNIEAKEKYKILDICEEANVKVKLVPSINELIDNEVALNKMRDVDLRDLLGREEIKLDKDGINEYLSGKVVLVTGGGGSIGSELCRQIAKFKPKKLLILDNYENNAYDLQNELTRSEPDLQKEVIIASVREKDRIDSIFEHYRPQVVFHAAAHKHVPLMEDNPQEAIRNNVCGTLNLGECSDKYKVEKFVLISTDKAVNPTNVMGATKRLCEMIVQALNKKSKTEFVAVRFGNVLGSNGSVIPLFKKQISEGGPVTLTHRDIIRYFMLIPEAAQLVLQAGAYAKGGEIFVLDMGKPVKIYDLAEKLIRLSGFEPNKDIEIKITGLRPGEKLYEELLMSEEGLENTAHEKIFTGKLSEFDLDELKVQINELLEVVKTGNKEMIKKGIRKIVPTYTITEITSNNINKDEAAITEQGED